MTTTLILLSIGFFVATLVTAFFLDGGTSGSVTGDGRFDVNRNRIDSFWLRANAPDPHLSVR